MRHKLAYDATHEDLYLAGERVRPGIYQQIGGDREVRLEREDVLPASLDGRVACYMRITPNWQQINRLQAAQV